MLVAIGKYPERNCGQKVVTIRAGLYDIDVKVGPGIIVLHSHVAIFSNIDIVLFLVILLCIVVTFFSNSTSKIHLLLKIVTTYNYIIIHVLLYLAMYIVLLG